MNEERPTSAIGTSASLSDVPGVPGSHLISLMRVLVIIPQSCMYPSDRGAPVAWKDSSQSVTKLGDWASGGFPSAFQHRPLLPTHPDSGEQRTGP